VSSADRQRADTPPTISIAEGDLVRSTNDLYKEYGVGRVQKVRNEHAKVEFNPSVFMTPPYRSENKILPLAELEKIDTPLDRGARGQWEPAWRFELKMLAARLLNGQQGGAAFQCANRDFAAPDFHRPSRRLQSAAAIPSGR
jgi:hypothetical protein